MKTPTVMQICPLKPIEKHIDEVMTWFDFQKVHQIMVHMDWKWVGTENKVPEIIEMKQLVCEYMEKLYNNYSKCERCCISTGSGGFDIRYTKGIDNGKPFDSFAVAFNLTYWDTE